MRIPYEWLKDYVPTDLTPDALAERLTMAGLEVERVEYPWPNVVTAQITWLQPVEGSNHLNAARITTGTGEELSVVCGAPNIKLYDKVPLAKVGAKIGDITIGETVKMGVRSQGMLCSPRELGISDDHSGIYILPGHTPLGVPLGQVIGEPVIELDIKAHRGDLSSVVGVAREVSAFTGVPLKLPEVHVPENDSSVDVDHLMRLQVDDAELCPRYTARVVRNVRIGPSPRWMAERLIAAGMRPINNVVDVTNYVMLELGQPLHAFDYDKVTDHTIVVRRAHPGEELTTLDGVTRRLTNDMLLITDPAGPAVIAGIFGGARVEVDDQTRNVILESAHFNPANIRRTAQALGLRTESSSRFEKNPDIELTWFAICRAAHLLAEVAQGEPVPGCLDFYPTPARERQLDFDLEQVNWLTGMRVSSTEAMAALRGLEFGVEEQPSESGKVLLRVRVPTWRGDIEESADLVEEIARIVGYDRIPSSIPTGPLPAPISDSWFERESRVRDIMLGAGLSEVVNYPLTSRPQMLRLLTGTSQVHEAKLDAPSAAAQLPAASAPGEPLAELSAVSGDPGERAVTQGLPAITLRNPASSEMDTLRLTLMSGLLTVVRENSKHSDAGLWFFELGRRYLPTAGLTDGKSLAQERRTLGIALTGPLAPSWLGPEREADFFAAKGIVEMLIRTLRVAETRFTPLRHPTFHPGRCARIEVAPQRGAEDILGGAAMTGNVDVRSLATDDDVAADHQWVSAGVIGEIHPEVAERFEVPVRTYVAELDLEPVFAAIPGRVTYQSVPRYPAAQRDMAIVVANDVPAQAIGDTIRASSDLVRAVTLFDVYTAEGVPEGKRSLAFSITYQSPERTLGEREIEAAQTAALDTLRERFGAERRG